jgi:hypothetical protein
MTTTKMIRMQAEDRLRMSRFTKKAEMLNLLRTEYEWTDSRGHGIYLALADILDICDDTGVDPEFVMAMAHTVRDDLT